MCVAAKKTRREQLLSLQPHRVATYLRSGAILKAYKASTRTFTMTPQGELSTRKINEGLPARWRRTTSHHKPTLRDGPSTEEMQGYVQQRAPENRIATGLRMNAVMNHRQPPDDGYHLERGSPQRDPSS